MKKADLPVEKRLEKGKNFARRLRRQGKIPAVLYGKGSEPIPLTVDKKSFISILHGQESLNTIVNMKIEGSEGQEMLSIPKDIQFDPLYGNIVHIDFQQIHLDQMIHTQVPIHVVGISPGVKTGGIMEHLMRELEVSCFPMDIPDCIEVDISNLQIGESIHVRDIAVGEDIRILNDIHTTIVLVAAPTLEKVVEEEKPLGEGEGEAPLAGESTKDESAKAE